MFFGTAWRRITTSQRARERDAAALRESALRDEFARRTHALGSQIAQAHAENCRLRAENRALLNSVLGIAGIPPVIVADPPDLPFVGASAAADRASADACLDVGRSATVPPQERRPPEEPSDEGSLFVSAGCLDAKPKRGPSGESGPQDDGMIRGGASANGATSPTTNLGPQGSATASTNAQHDSSVLRQERTRLGRAANDPHAFAPIRRRSWHQIYRMLEFESSRRKANEP